MRRRAHMRAHAALLAAFQLAGGVAPCAVARPYAVVGRAGERLPESGDKLRVAGGEPLMGVVYPAEPAVVPHLPVHAPEHLHERKVAQPCPAAVVLPVLPHQFFIKHSFMGGMLIDHIEAILILRQNVGVENSADDGQILYPSSALPQHS